MHADLDARLPAIAGDHLPDVAGVEPTAGEGAAVPVRARPLLAPTLEDLDRRRVGRHDARLTALAEIHPDLRARELHVTRPESERLFAAKSAPVEQPKQRAIAGAGRIARVRLG